MIFQEKYFNWPNVIVCLCIVIICGPICDVINFGINRGFFNQAVFLHDQKSKQKVKCLKNEKTFLDKIKYIFHHF